MWNIEVKGAWALIGVKKKEGANGAAQKVTVVKKDTNLQINMMLTATVALLVVINDMNVSQKKNIFIIHIATTLGQSIQ